MHTLEALDAPLLQVTDSTYLLLTSSFWILRRHRCSKYWGVGAARISGVNIYIYYIYIYMLWSKCLFAAYHVKILHSYAHTDWLGRSGICFVYVTLGTQAISSCSVLAAVRHVFSEGRNLSIYIPRGYKVCHNV